MHILVVNDDGPPSPTSSPYIHSFVHALQARGHIVSVVLPHTQRSWIGKAHMIGQNVIPSYYHPGPVNQFEGTTHSSPHSSRGKDEQESVEREEEEEYVLLNSTPATCVQIGLYHYFQDKPPIDLVVSGPNYGRNVTSVFSLSSGTLGAALEAATCRKRAIALSYAFFRKEGEAMHKHDFEVVGEANSVSVKLIEWLMEHWDDEGEGKADLYSINIPLVKGVGGNKVLWTEILENRWEVHSCFEEVLGEESNAEEEEEHIREAEGGVNGIKGEGIMAKRLGHKHKHFKWTPRFQDVYKSVKRSGEGNDGRAIMEHNTSVTPLKANFMHALGRKGEIKLPSNPLHTSNTIAKMEGLRMENLTIASKGLDHINMFVNYEDAYVQPSILEAIRSRFPPGSYTLMASPNNLPSTSAYLHIGAYEALPFDHILIYPTTSMTNAYIIRKALIRKHYLSNTVQSWIAKHPESILATNFKASCSFELDYAEFLDDALVEAWELKASFESNQGQSASEREWWILKPGMSDRGQGIRLFSTEEELQAIFEGWEAESPESDEESEAEGAPESADENKLQDEGDKPKDYIISSHLRHFLAQPYIHTPLLLPQDPRKFHIRTYVLALGALKIYVYKPMLALFASKPYVPPWSTNSSTSGEIDLALHLTNTCLQSSSSSSSPPSSSPSSSAQLLSTLPLPPHITLQSIHTQIFNLTGEIFEAAARSQSIHFQPLPNAFEVFGLDFLVDVEGRAWLLECNAFPDFAQTGEELRGVVGGFWGAVMGVVGGWWGLGMADGDGNGDTELVLVRVVDLGRR